MALDKQFSKAIIVAPLAPVVALFFLLTIKQNLQLSLMTLVFAMITSYLGTLLLGIPALKLLQRFKILNLFTLVLAGSILGMLAFYLGFFFFIHRNDFNVYTALFGVACGFLVSLIFGLITDINKSGIKNK